MKKLTFEDFLMEKHGEDYRGTDDNMPDAFNDWVDNLSIEEWFSLGDLYGVERALRATNKAIEILKGETK